MTDPPTRRAKAQPRWLVLLTSMALLAGLLAVVPPPLRAAAAETLVFDNTFKNRTVNGTGTVTKPTSSSGTNQACLTASGNTSTPPLLSCSSISDAQGSGALRLTAATTGQVGAVMGSTAFPTSGGLEVSFNSYQYSNGAGADGIGVILGAVNPSSPTPQSAVGPGGSSLGYSSKGTVPGLDYGYLGVGLDVAGGFSSTAASGSGCTNPSTISSIVAGAIVVRGPGSGTTGYCGLTTTYTGSSASQLTLRGGSRAASIVPVRVLVNPTALPITSSSGVSVAAMSYKVVATPVGATSKTLTGTLPAVPTTLYPSTSWLDTNGVPKQLSLGFFASSSNTNDAHEISNLQVRTLTSVSTLAVTTTSYATATPAPGAPVTYSVAASVEAGADVSSPVTVTQTVPTGVTPLAAYGDGWVCQPPSGKTISCTTSASSFVSGTTLPAITYVAIVTGQTVTTSTIQNGSPTSVTSTGATSATDTATTVGTNPAAPSGLTASPASGSTAGGNTVTLTRVSGTTATAVEIGTTAETEAGNPVTLLPCASGATISCFSLTGTSVTVYMPARASTATVSLTLVTLGVASAVNYTYTDRPATIATPTATAGITSAVLDWVAPASNGSPITGYTVTTYLNDVSQGSAFVAGSATTRTLTGLTPGGSYTFTVAAVNLLGTSDPSPKSAAVVPYALPGAPTIGGVVAADLAVTVSWTAPSSNGSAITGYVVTPYIGTTAQTAQTFASSATSQSVTGLTAGTAYTFTVAAQNAAGTGPASARSTAATPNALPTLTFAAPPAGEVGVPYSTQLTVNNGTSPFAWSISSGSLPAGLTLSSSGLLGGTPTASGSFPVTVRVVDASGQAATRSVTLVIEPAPVVTFSPAAGEVTVPYSQQPTVTGGTAPYVWKIGAGSLPAGVTLDTQTGLVSGTPTAAGTFSVTLVVTDSFAVSASRTASVVIAALPTLTFTAPPSAQVAVAYSTSFTAAGGTAPLAWSISAGSVPSGLTLNTSTGVLSGTPTTVATSSFTVTVTDANNKTASKPVTLVVGAGPLVIAKTANVGSTVAGGVVAFTITVTNTGTSAFTGVTLTDSLGSPGSVLDDATYNANVTATSGTVNYAASAVTWSGDVAAGASVTITYSVTVSNPDTGNQVLSSTVTSSTSGTNCPSGGTDTRCTATVTVAGLSIVKSASPSSTTPGSVVRFSILVSNTGKAAYTGATLTDQLAGVLDDASYNADGAATAGQLSFTSPQLTWTGNLAVGASVTITYSVTVADPDVGNKSLVATVVSATAGSTCPSGSPAASCTTTVPVLVPGLAITNAASSSTTTPGAAVTYTQTVSNNGQTPYTGISVTLALSGALDDAGYTSSSASSGTVVYNAGAGTVVWTGDLALGATVTLIETLSVTNPAAGDRSMTVAASSAAAGSTCPVGGSSAGCTATVQVLVPALTITQTTNVSSTTPGGVVRYTVTVANTGQTAYTGATFDESLTGVLDDATYNADAAASSGTVSYSVPTLSWTGNLAVGATATITYSVTARAPGSGDLSLVSTVVSGTPFNNCAASSTDSRCARTVPVLVPGLTISTTVDPATTVPGGVVRYAVAVTNTGQTTYNGASISWNFAGVLDDAAYNNDAVTTTGSLVTNANGSFVWTLSLAPGQSAQGTTSFTVLDPTPISADKVLSSSVASDVAGSTCPTGSSSTSCRTSVPVLTPALTITKTANTSSVVTGGTVAYTILIANAGQTSYPAATVTDDLAAVLDDATYSDNATATTGTVSRSGSVLSWTGALAPGASATVSYSVVVKDPDPGDKRLSNTVTSNAARNNCAAGSTDSRCTAVVNVLVPGLTIAKTADAASTVPGAIVSYTVAVTNSGATSYTGATFSDALGSVLDDASYSGDAVASGGSVSYSGQTLTWTGDLAVGASASLTYSVTVRATSTGDNLLTNTVTSSSSGNNCVVGSVDPRCGVVVPVARLVLERVPVPPVSTTPGSVVDLSVRYSNVGQVPYAGISVDIPRADSSDDVFATGADVASSGTLVRTASTTRWTGDIPVGGVVTVTIIRTVRDPDTGNKVITAPLQSDVPGSNCPSVGATDPRCSFTTVVLVPGLTITKSVSSTSVEPGGVVGYTITVRNSGQTAYAGSSGTAAVVSDSLVSVLDDAVYNGDAVASSGSVSYSSPGLSWTGDLAVDATAVISYSVTAKDPATGDKTLTNSAVSSNKGSSCLPGNSVAGCRATTTVLTPQLTITKTADRSNATLGSTVTFTLTATNSGQTSYPAASLSDSLAGVLDDATYHAGATTGGPAYSNGVLSWSGALAPGASKTITYSVTVNDPATGNLVLDNTVVSTTTGSNCASGSADARCRATVSITDSVALTLTKTASVLSTVDGGTVVFTVTATNASAAALTSVNFSDPLGSVLDDASYSGDAVASGGSVSYSGQSSTLSWVGTVPAGGTVTVTYSVRVGSPAAGDLLLTSKISSTSPSESNNCVVGSVDPRCGVVVPVARLVLERVPVPPVSTTPGSVVDLSVRYSNVGQVPYAGISVDIPRADSSDDVFATGADVASSGTLVRTASTTRWTGDIPVGGVVTVTIIRTVRDPDTGNKVITAPLQSDAPGSNCPSVGATDPRCSFTTVVLVPGLTITKSVSSTSVEPGGVVGYTITVRNTGQTAYAGSSGTAAVVSDSLVSVLDDAVYNGDAVASSGSVSYSSPGLSWTGDLAVDATAVISYSVTAKDPATGDKTLTNSAVSSNKGSSCLPGNSVAGCRATTTVLTPQLTISSSVSKTSAVPGDVVDYSVTVTNTGQTGYADANLTAPLAGLTDDAVYAGGAAATTGTVTLTGSNLFWSGALAVGSTATITYSVTVKSQSQDAGDHRLDQTLTSSTRGSNCAGGSTDARCRTSVAIASLQIVNSTDVTTTEPTKVVRHRGTFTNTGQVPYVGITVYDSFVGTLDDATYNGDATASSGSLIIVVGSGRIVWTGDVAVGETVTITGSVTVNNPPTGDGTLTTLIRTDAAATNCPTGGTDPACATSVTLLHPALTISKVASTTTTTPGSTVSYTITATNTGETNYTGAAIRDDLTEVLTDSTISTPAAATRGEVAFSNQVLTWMGDLGINETVVISYSLRVDDPDLGDKTMVNTVTSDNVGSSCPTGGNAAGCTATVTVLVPALTIDVAADSTTTTPGSAVDYTITVTNSGEIDYAGSTVTADLGGVLDDASYGGGATSTVPGQFTFAEGVLSWTGDLAVGQTTVITYRVTVSNPDVGNRDLATSVSSPAAGSTCTAAVPCVDHVAVLLPGLAVSTTADVASATPGDPVTFTIRIHNTGETVYPSTQVTTDLTGVLDDATFGGTITASSGTTAYAAPELTWTGALALDQTVVLTYTVVVKPSAGLGDHVLRTTVVAEAAGSTCPTGSVSSSCTAEVQVLVPALTITKSADTETTTPGGQVVYTITITNAGETTYTDATVSDSLAGLLDEATYGADATVTGGGVLAYANSTLTWTGDLLPAATATIHYSVRVKNPYVGDRLLTNSAVSSAPGSTCPTGDPQPGCASVVRVLMPALGVTQTADKTSVVAGDAVTYTVTLTNTGETDYLPATFRDSFADPGILKFADYALDATATVGGASVGTVSYDNQTLVWTGPLLMGETATVRFSVVTRYPAPAPVDGVRLMRNKVTSATAGSTCVNGTRARCQTAVTVLSPSLTLTKTADTSQVVAGGVLRYTIAATNDGEADYAATSLSDDLSGILAHSTYRGDATATSGAVGYSNGTLTWSGPIAKGATVLISFSVGVAVDTPDSTVLTNRVVSSAVGSNCAAGSDAAGCVSSTSIAARTISLSNLTPSFTLSGLPSTTVTQEEAVSMTVTTNSVSGYTVSLRATGNALTGTAGNADTIPISRLLVRNSSTDAYQPVPTAEPLTIYRKNSASGGGGDAVSNDYQVEIPDVASDTYSTTIEYIATAQ